MKNLFLFLILIFICNNVNAAFSDEISNYGLYHCDVTNVTPWHTETPDDNSSSRAFNPALMEYQSEQPVLTPRSGGGSCLYFDGNNAGLYIPDYSGYIGWPGDQDTFVADISVKWEELPAASGDNRVGLIVAGTWNIFLRNNGSGKGIIEVVVKNTADLSTYLSSDVTLNADTWYDVHAQLSNGVVSLTINGTTKTTAMSGMLKQGSIQVEIGQGIYLPRYFKGYLDEIRYGFFAKAFGPEIDNSNLLPAYKPDNEVSMEGDSPDWLKTLIMAQFRVETVTYEGDFSNAVRILDHYAKTGVNGLWINPIYERTGNNGYLGFGPNLIDDKIAGTSDINLAFKRAKEFVDEAHARNIRIFFDVVIWGVSSNSPLVSAHPDWFNPYNSDINGFFYKTDNTDWQEWFIQQATNLVISTGADGFRCDTEPASTGYALWEEVRQRCYSVGKKVGIISEQYSTRNGVYDFEQIGVGYVSLDDWEKVRESGNYFISNNIVDSVKTGVAIGIPESEQGRGRFYTYNLSNHDSFYQTSFGNIVRFGYQAVFSPFIPMWYIGEEWNCQPDVSAILYFTKINWSKMLNEPNFRFFEKVKKLIRIRRQYPDIFQYYPANHRDSNICKVNVAGNNLQSYARYKDGKGILIIPNYNDSSSTFSFVPPYSDMGMDAGTIFKVTDLLNDEIIFTNLNISSTININISNQSLAVLLVEKNDGSFTPYDDSWSNILLMHCDDTNQYYWLETADDNSSGRSAAQPILDINNTATGRDVTKEPALMPGSPYGGSYFSFDGINDDMLILPYTLWPSNKFSVVCDFSIRWKDLPPAGEYSATIQTKSWRGFLYNNGGKGGINFLTEGGVWITSPVQLDSNVWYSVSFQDFNGNATLTVGGTVTTVSGAPIGASTAHIRIGNDLYAPDTRYFKGDLDEIRVGIIPEPFYSCPMCGGVLLIIYYLIFITRHASKRVYD
ncbi:MAG: hypothetical protein DRI44_04050 [Chlamydiae bacterium]|nr:MAG: hypothetical protein DRI44_04050 [Chlamydiota bacterium]